MDDVMILCHDIYLCLFGDSGFLFVGIVAFLMIGRWACD